MGKILNLASLKSKADTAGVGTTATSTTPNLCPLKSAIAGYVTNGSSTVSISGTWADNLLVPEENVAVGKTIVATYPRYRNVSVGTATNPDGDIPASGGARRRALATVTYEWATVTVYSDNSETVGTWQPASSVIYGGYIPSSGNTSSLGTTFKTRTSLGTSTPSGHVAGATRTATGISIYQAANYITKITPTSSEGHSYHVSYDNISSGGGSSSPTMWGRAIYTFSSGSTATSGSTTPFTNVTATFTRVYPVIATNPSSAFSLNTGTGVITASRNTGSGSRTAIILALLTVSITYTGSYAGVFTACSAGTVTHLPPCTLNGVSAPTTGYNVAVLLPSSTTTPNVSWYYGSTYRGLAHSRLSSATSVHNTWNNTGTVNRVYVVENGSNLKYLTITGANGVTILSKTLIGNYAYYDLTTTFNTSSYDNGSTNFVFTYSNS